MTINVIYTGFNREHAVVIIHNFNNNFINFVAIDVVFTEDKARKITQMTHS